NEVGIASPIPSQTPQFSPPSADDNATQAAQVVPVFSPEPTTDMTALSGASSLSAAAVGATLSIFGTLTIENSLVVVTTEAGERAVLDMPVDLAQMMAGNTVYVVGVVTSTEGSTTLQLTSIQEMAAPPAAVFATPNAEAATTDTGPALPTFAPDLRLAENLTALDAYDQLIGQIAGDALGARQWISTSGNPSAGWSFSFYNEADNTVLIYTVLPDGTVLNQLGIPPVDTQQIFALDRASLTLDSDRLLEIYTENGGADALESLVLLLQAVDAETSHWEILDAEGVTQFTLDAVSGDIVP
ncbi:MAG: hypothetical protein U0694_28840, partial [Anaerolineae bacterium]